MKTLQLPQTFAIATSLMLMTVSAPAEVRVALTTLNPTVVVGGQVGVDVALTTTAGEEVVGATYFLNVTGPSPEAIEILSNSNGVPAVFSQLQTPSPPDLSKDIGGFNSTLQPVPGGANIASTLNLQVAPDAPEGDYTLAFLSSGSKGAVWADDSFDTAPFNYLGSLVLTVTNSSSDPDGDDDNDGMTNGFEDRFPFLDKNDPSDAALDYDNDGVSNKDEAREGTDAGIANVNLTFVGILSGNTGTSWSFGPLVPGISYSLHYRANTSETWSLAVGPVTVSAPTSSATVDHPMALPVDSPRNYRVFAEPVAP